MSLNTGSYRARCRQAVQALNLQVSEIGYLCSFAWMVLKPKHWHAIAFNLKLSQYSLTCPTYIMLHCTNPKERLAQHVVDQARREVREESALMRLVFQNGKLLVGARAELLPHCRVPARQFGIRELPDVMSANFSDFLTPSPLYHIWISIML